MSAPRRRQPTAADGPPVTLRGGPYDGHAWSGPDWHRIIGACEHTQTSSGYESPLLHYRPTDQTEHSPAGTPLTVWTWTGKPNWSVGHPGTRTPDTQHD